MISIAISFLIMIVAVSVSSGFRNEIRDGISALSGDVQLLPVDMNYISASAPISAAPSFIGALDSLPGVGRITPAVYRAGIIKRGENIHGVLFKGVPKDSSRKDPADTVRLGVAVPKALSGLLGIGVGDKLLTYFVGERVQVRNFTVVREYEAVMDGTDKLIVLADLRDLQRLNGWSGGEVSALEVALRPACRNPSGMRALTAQIGEIALNRIGEADDSLVATSVQDRYPQIFDWLNLIDFNVLFILVLMTIVAGFNMISGLLILLFRNISTIGTLKSVGMTDRSIAKVFLRVSSGIVLKGMALGNGIALAFCALQGATHALKLNPRNYFVSFVPVRLNLPAVLVADAAAYLVIMLLLLIPCLFIARVDPAQTVRAQ